MYKLDLEKAEGPEIKLTTFVGSWRKQRNSRKNIYLCYAKTFDSVGHNKLWKILKETGVPDHPTCFLIPLMNQPLYLVLEMYRLTLVYDTT